MPQVAAMASVMEATKLPLRELRTRYTRSELAMMAWRSSEVAFNMQESMKSAQAAQNANRPDVVQTVRSAAAVEEKLANIEEQIGSFVWKAVDEKGDIDLGKFSPQELRTYMNAIGMPLPFAP